MLEDSKRTTAERKELDLQGARMAELAIEEEFFENKGRNRRERASDQKRRQEQEDSKAVERKSRKAANEADTS